MRLQTEKREFYRLKSGQKASEAEDFLGCPVNVGFAGAIIRVTDCFPHIVRPFETYETIAANYGVEEEELKAFNGGRPLYPSRRIFIPRTR